MIYIFDIHHQGCSAVGESTGKIFKHGRSQAIRIPKEFRLPGKEVRIRRAGRGILIEPIETDARSWLARLRTYADTPFMPDGREQPPMPADDPEQDLDKPVGRGRGG